MISLFTGRRFCAEVARTLGVKPNLFGSALLEMGVTWAHFKALKRASYSAEEAVEVLLPQFANGLAVVKARFGDQAEILEAEQAIKNRMGDSGSDLSTRAYEYANDVLSEVGIIKGLASLHRLGLENRNDEAELRGIVLGAYRTVAVGGALAARYMDTHQGSKEDISQAFWNFVNESAVRGIAVEIGDTLLPDEPSPVGIIEREFETLFACGYEIGRLHGERAAADAFDVWRTAMKSPIIEGDLPEQ